MGKTLHPNGQQREDVVAQRARWKKIQEKLDTENIYFIMGGARSPVALTIPI
jgi:hypothetical protein